jgi:exonuclease SbcD
MPEKKTTDRDPEAFRDDGFFDEGALRVLHTSDWHLGRSLGRLKRRHEEQGKFLEWLLQAIEREKVDALLVSGDVFDSVSPPAEAQALYYGFLASAARSRLRHVVVSSGNHDSEAFLNAPRELLKRLHVHVSADAGRSIEDEVLVLDGPDGSPELVVAAAPFLRDRSLRTAVEGESIEDRERRAALGVARHYEELAALAVEKRGGRRIPIIAMGHLFAKGGVTHDGDGVREIYAGPLSRVDASLFPEAFDYVALGHLHSPQRAGRGNVRYSGAPLHMSFDEASRKGKGKSVALCAFKGGRCAVREIPVPVFQELVTIKGGHSEIRAGLSDLKKKGSPAWIQIVYDSDEPAGDLRAVYDPMAKGAGQEILIINNLRAYGAALGDQGEGRPLREYSPEEVFARLLEARNVPEKSRAELEDTFRMVLASYHESQGEGGGQE